MIERDERAPLRETLGSVLLPVSIWVLAAASLLISVVVSGHVPPALALVAFVAALAAFWVLDV